MSLMCPPSPERDRIVLLVDDREISRDLVASELEDAGYRVVAAADGDSGWESFQKQRFDLVISDLRMPKSDGMSLLHRIRSPESHSPQVPVILLSAYGTLSVAAEAGKAGVTDFFPLNQAGIEQLMTRVEEIFARGCPALPDVLAGGSREITALRRRLQALAGLEAPLLLVGEPGTNRWRVAMYLHRLSPLAHQPLIKVPCGEEPPPREPPASGTLYLSNVDALSVQAQHYWLRQLDGVHRPPQGAALRVIASASQDLTALTEEGRFNAGLAAQLSRFTARIPPLRERAEDLPAIADAVLPRIAARLGRHPPRLTDGAVKRLAEHPWNENLIELERVLESLAAYAPGDEIAHALVGEALHEFESPLSRIADQRARRERQLLLALYRKHGTYTGVARELGITRNAAKYRFSKHGLLPPPRFT